MLASEKQDKRPITGGAVVVRPKPLKYRPGDVIGLRLISDTHIGASNVDYRMLKWELDQAAKHRDRVLINGDVFDAILPSDHKRFDPHTLHPRIRGRRNVLGECLEWAYEIFKPYAHLIDFIGVGNHDEAVHRHHSFDIVMELIKRLQADVDAQNIHHRVHHGGYLGYVDYRLKKCRQDGTLSVNEDTGKPSNSYRFVVFYHHGSGGGAPVTKGMIDFNRRQTWTSCDVMWFGHKHVRNVDHVQRMECPQNGIHPTLRDMFCIHTGAYFDTYRGQSQESILTHGRRTNYAADMALAPQGKGGVRVELHCGSNGYQVRVQM